MTISLMCPNCNVASEFKKPPIASCPKCGNPFPDSLRSSADQSLRRQKPLLIKIGMVFSVLIGAFFLLFALVVLGTEGGSYTINGHEVTRQHFVSHAIPLIVLSAIILLAIAYGFWKERPWSRHLAILYWLVVGFFMLRTYKGRNIPEGFLIIQALNFIIPAAVAVWYFYFKPNVVAYYHGLAKQD